MQKSALGCPWEGGGKKEEGGLHEQFQLCTVLFENANICSKTGE